MNCTCLCFTVIVYVIGMSCLCEYLVCGDLRFGKSNDPGSLFGVTEIAL